MSNKRREERQRLIARDDGDPEDVVWLPAAARTDRAYHDRQDCQNAQSAYEVEQVTRAEAQAMLGAYPCKRCVLETVDEQKPTGTPLASLLKDPDVSDPGDLERDAA